MAAAARTSIGDVFINCPFDVDFKPIFEAMVFTIFACEFRPRSALELDDGGQLRLEKLYAIIAACRFGIHDLSRTELDAANKLPRFNMPLELGIFLGAKRYGGAAHGQKLALILDVEQYRYQKFISDLAGMDIRAHGGDPRQAIVKIRDWLTNVSRRDLPSSARLLRSYDLYLADLPVLAAALELDPIDMTYADFERLVANWLSKARPNL